MNTKTLLAITSVALLPLLASAQAPPAPPAPPAPAAPPVPPNPPINRHEKKVPVTWLGVETSSVPQVVSDQLGLAKGFGLVVDYVVPDGPAAAGGVQQNDILKMLNDQILTEPGQLSKLIRSFADGTTVTLTVLRKGVEQKIPVKLVRHEVGGGMFGEKFDHDFEKQWHDREHDMGALREEMEKLKENIRNSIDVDSIRETVTNARRQAMQAAEEARRRARDLRITSRDARGLKSTRIDVGKAQIVYSDEEGELRLENVDGKKVFTAKDRQGKLLFSGPVETKEDLDKLPPEVRQRYEKLQESQLSVEPGQATFGFTTADADDKDDDQDCDACDGDDDDSDDDDNGSATSSSVQQVKYIAPAVQRCSNTSRLSGIPRQAFGLSWVMI